MAVSFIKTLIEEERQSVTGDDKYNKKGKFVFVLHGPPGEGPLSPLEGRAQFPLILNPESFEYNLPFAAEITPLQEGGVVAEEGGIVIGEISLQGTMGFKIRKPLGDTSFTTGDGDFTGLVDPGGLIANGAAAALGVTGHMHFWRLAGRCFDGYSALKKNPKHAPKTRMEFHSIKDDLHLLVVPREFRLTRSASKERFVYRYSIRCAVVGPASETHIHIPSPDVGLLQTFKNTVSKIRNAIQSIGAAIDDITAAIDEVRRAVLGVAGIIDDVSGIVDSFTDLVDGVKKFADIPGAFIKATANLVESAANLAGAVTGFPADVAQSFLNMATGLDRIHVAARDHFRENFDETARKYEQLTGGHQEGLDDARDEQAEVLKAEADSGQGRMSVQNAFGGAVKPGDVARGRRDPIKSRSRFRSGKFNGFEERIVGQGDTLQSLAAKYMGDAREWPAIAIANQLKAPYITSGGKMTGTITIGDRITIPVTQTVNAPDTLTTGEAVGGGSQAENLWGRDFELTKLPNGQYGWAIDSVAGSTDARHVEGEKNLVQAIDARFRTEQGQNILYTQIGLPRLVGDNSTESVFVNARYEARRQLLADPRIERLASFKLLIDQDSMIMESSIQPVGAASTRTISRMLT